MKFYILVIAAALLATSVSSTSNGVQAFNNVTLVQEIQLIEGIVVGLDFSAQVPHFYACQIELSNVALRVLRIISDLQNGKYLDLIFAVPQLGKYLLGSVVQCRQSIKEETAFFKNTYNNFKKVTLQEGYAHLLVHRKQVLTDLRGVYQLIDENQDYYGAGILIGNILQIYIYG